MGVMKPLPLPLVTLFATACSAPTPAPEPPRNFHTLRTRSLAGEPVDLAAYAGVVALVVNVASECGYTPQYAGLQRLHDELKGRGFVVLGFPSNDFGGQEPGSPAQIQAFCSRRYAVGFPLFEKVRTMAGEGQSDVYRWLGSSGKLPNWNFCKYLIGADGTVRGFYPSKVAPDDATLRAAIEAALAEVRR